MQEAAGPSGSNSTNPEDDDVVLNLGRTTIKILLLHIMGYWSVSTGVFTKPALGGLGMFVRCFALPALLFQGIATLDTADIEAPLIATVVLAKAILMLVACALAWLREHSLGGVGTMALCSTMSDDIGLGVPLLSGVFGPGRVKMLYILSAIQALLFNPIAYVLLALGKTVPPQQQENGLTQEQKKQHTSSNKLRAVLLRVLRDTATNPLVASCVLGGLYRLTIGNVLPSSRAWFAFDTTELVGSAFTPLVLFLAGASLFGSVGSLTSARALTLPLLLVALKSVLLPTLTSLLAGPLHADPIFSFEYGALSTATSAYVIVQSSGVAQPTLTGVSASLALGKAFCFLLVFIYVCLLRGTTTEGLLGLTWHFANVMHGAGLAGNTYILGALAIEPGALRACQSLRGVAVMSMLQWAFDLAFLAVGDFWDDQPPQTQTWLFMVVSITRWTLNGWHVAHALVHTAACVRSLAPLSSFDSIWARVPLRLAASLLVGLLATLPWTFASGNEFPAGSGIATWVPYGRAQTITFAGVYAICALTLGACLGMILTLHAPTAKVDTSEGGGQSAEGTGYRVQAKVDTSEAGGQGADELCASGDNDRLAPASAADGLESESADGMAVLAAVELDVRFKSHCILCIALLRTAVEVVLCVELAYNSTVTLTTCQVLLLCIALEDGQGVHTALLLGFSPHVRGVYRRAYRRIVNRLNESYRRLAPATEAPRAAGREAPAAYDEQLAPAIAFAYV